MSGGALAATALTKLGAQTVAAEETAEVKTMKGAFKHSVCKFCYKGIPLDQFCKDVKKIGIESIELLRPKEWATLREHDLICAVGTPGSIGGIGGIQKGFNRIENHETLYELFDRTLKLAVEAGNVQQLICFSGNRDGMDDETGLKNCAIGLKKIMPLAEKHGITLTMELLNSKRTHADYMADHTEWGAALVDEVASERFKLLYDIFHMQIMEGDCIETFTKYQDRISHYHAAGNPGRNEIDDTQELNYRGICKALAKNGYTGFLAQEFFPTKDPLTSLREGVEICTV